MRTCAAGNNNGVRYISRIQKHLYATSACRKMPHSCTPFIHLFIHPFINQLINQLIYPLTHPFIHTAGSIKKKWVNVRPPRKERCYLVRPKRPSPGRGCAAVGGLRRTRNSESLETEPREVHGRRHISDRGCLFRTSGRASGREVGQASEQTGGWDKWFS